MSKKTKRFIVLVTMIMFGTIMLSAQESNTSKATFGEIVNDGDNFLSSTDWKSVDFKNVFGFSRFGANIADGWLDLGAGVKAGEKFYLGLYYNGLVIGQPAGDSISEKVYLKDGDSEPVNLSSIRKGNNQATYAALVGIGDIGIKLEYVDDLQVTGTTPAPGSANAAWTGTLTPSVELGGAFGPISKIRLSIPFKYDRTIVTTAAPGIPGTGGTITSTTTTGSATTGDHLLDEEGNYAEPDLYLKLGFGSFTLENDLSLRIYGTPAYKTGGKSGVQGGVGIVTTSYQSGGTDTRRAVWDNRFYIADTITPSYNINGDTGKLGYSVSFYLPVGLALTTHSLNAKSEGAGSDWELKGASKGSDFDMTISPSLALGLQFKPAPVFSVQGGINAEFFSWGLEAESTSKVDLSADDLTRATAVGITPTGKSSNSTSTLALPKLSFAAGFTVNFKEIAALDFVFVKVANPTAAGTIYKAVGDGLGSDETSVVLTVKF
jgi:hypothetical protein